jgi:hypothetical protein
MAHFKFESGKYEWFKKLNWKIILGSGYNKKLNWAKSKWRIFNAGYKSQNNTSGPAQTKLY